MSEEVFGRIIHAGQVEDAVREALQERFSTVLADAETQWGMPPGTLRRPARRDWVRTTDPEQIPVAELPTVAIENVGALEEPGRDEDGHVAITFGINIAIFAKGRNRDEALDNARMLLAAMRATFVGRNSLGDFADARWLIDEGYDVIAANRERTLAAAELVCAVRVGNVATVGAGPEVILPFPPDVPDWPDYDPPPEADTVNVTINPIQE